MVTAISGSSQTYVAPSINTTTSSANAINTASTTTSAKPQKFGFDEKVALAYIDSGLEMLRMTASIAKGASDEVLGQEAQAMRAQGLSEEKIQDYIAVEKGHSARAEASLADAKSTFEARGFKVTGNVYEKGADGEWRMGHFALNGQGDGYTIHYDSNSGASVSRTTRPATPPANAGSPEVVKAAATVKAADANEIYAKAQAQADQFNKLINLLGQSADRFRESGWKDAQAESETRDLRKQVEGFQFDPWEVHMRQAGFAVGESLIGRDATGRATLAIKTVTGVFEGTNVAVSYDRDAGTRFRYGGGAWQALDSQAVDEARATLAAALKMNLVA